MKDQWIVLAAVAIAGIVFFNMTETVTFDNEFAGPDEKVEPNWSSIANWPALEAQVVQAIPDPNRRITAIVLDDSGSMGGDMLAAKAAVLEALSSMDDRDRVAVVALNHGIVLPFTDVETARVDLPVALKPIHSDGTTPLTQAVASARELLEAEAAQARSFGTYRLIVTTDGQADDGKALVALVSDMAATTPIQLATIGIGVNGRHVLRRDDLGRFVDVSNIEALRGALEAAVAENASFDAITEFSEEG